MDSPAEDIWIFVHLVELIVLSPAGDLFSDPFVGIRKEACVDKFDASSL